MPRGVPLASVALLPQLPFVLGRRHCDVWIVRFEEKVVLGASRNTLVSKQDSDSSRDRVVLARYSAL